MTRPTNKYPLNNFRNNVCEELMSGVLDSVKTVLGKEDGFLIFINLFDRQSEAAIKEGKLIYGGIQTMRKALSDEQTDHLDDYWKYLQENGLEKENGIIGGMLFHKLLNGKKRLEDIEVGSLKIYFNLEESDQSVDAFKNKHQEAEYPILRHYFDLMEDCYLPLPLMLFGKLNGMVYLICKVSFAEKLKNLDLRESLIRSFLEIYERLYIEYGVAITHKSLEEILIEEFAYISSPSFKEREDTNQFFKEMELLEYYKNEKKYTTYFPK